MEYAISIGSNLGDRLANLGDARRCIAALPDTQITAASTIYETDPVGVAPEHEEKLYLNAILLLETSLQPEALAKLLHQIETNAGRTRSADRNAPRTLDLDIIYAGDLILSSKTLVIPHPRWVERRFVVQPLADLRPHLVVPRQTHAVSQILLALPASPKVVSFSNQWSI